MRHEWLPLHVLGPVAGAVAFVLAWMVYAARPGAPANRRLAILLVVEGAAAAILGASNVAETFGYDDPATQPLLNALLATIPGTYLLFLATLDSPLTRPLQGRAGTAICILLAVAPPAAWFVAGGGSFRGPEGRWVLLMVGLIVAGTLGLAASLAALATARTRQARFRARAAALAFGVHDVVWIAGAIVAGRVVELPLPVARLAGWGTPQIATLLLAPLLAYGILRYQLFDIELRLKRTLTRSTVAAVFVGVFFVVSELAQLVFSGFAGPVLGVVTAGLLLLALTPLQTAAERLADRAMPGVRDSPEYRTVRKADLYRATVEAAFADGTVSERERDVLARLQDELGVTATQAREIERSVAADLSNARP